MNKARLNIATSKLVGNSGQLDWLPRNPRQWTQGDIDRTVKSITTDPDFLEDRPLLAVPAESGKGERYIVFAGNLRLKACKESGVKTAPVVVYFPEGDEDRETVKRRAMLDNGSFGSWDYDALANEWDDLPLVDLGIPAWEPEQDADGFGAGEEGPAATEDDFDEAQDEIHVLCAKGDVWQLGDHRLMCGDSVDLEQVKTLMGGGKIKADMVFTDPPYGVSIGDKNAELNTVQPSGRCCENIKNDTLSVPALYDVLKQAMDNVRQNCADDACYYVCAPSGGDMGLMMMMMKDAGLNVRHQIVWNKNSATFSIGRLDYDYKHEAIMYTWTKTHHNYRKGAFRTSVWDIDKPRKCDLHPTMKPVELVSNCLLDGSKEGDIVLDAFGGSGTTLIAAEQLGRKCYMMELDPHYCDVIIARWEKLTGKKAIKIAG
jgi:site-specific DNA-methyltransferase (adenine-specific)